MKTLFLLTCAFLSCACANAPIATTIHLTPTDAATGQPVYLTAVNVDGHAQTLRPPAAEFFVDLSPTVVYPLDVRLEASGYEPLAVTLAGPYQVRTVELPVRLHRTGAPVD